MSFAHAHQPELYSFLIVPDSDIQETNIATSSAPAGSRTAG